MEHHARPRRRTGTRGHVLLALLVACGVLAGLFAAVAAGDARRDQVLGDERRAFDRSAAEISASVATTLHRNTDVVASAGAFVAFSPDLTNPEFQSWFDEWSRERYPGLMGFGYIERVADADLPAFVSEVAADPIPTSTGRFTLLPAGERPEYCLARLRAMGVSTVGIAFRLGVDVCAVPGFAEVFDEVRQSGDFAVMPLPATATGASIDLPALGASAIRGTEFFVIAPVRVPGSPPGDPDSVTGWILAGFDGPTIISSILPLDADLDLSLSWRDGGEPMVIAARPVAIEGPRVESVQTFTADGEWTMTVRRSAAGAWASARGQQRAVEGAVIAFTLLAMAFVWLLVGARNRALRLVDEKTDELQFQALHDGLTGLPNRVLILDRVDQMLRRARRHGISPVAMFLDIDDFKTINDTLGHAAGDGLLCAVAERLRSVVRDLDSVGRLGGDEFVVLVADGATAGWAEDLAQRLLDAMAEPVLLAGLGDVPLTIGVSIGIAMGDRPDADALLRDADVALYEAKAAGKGGYVVFEPAMGSAVTGRLALATDLRDAVGSDELSLVYQPTFSLDTGTVIGVEALVRWNHPTRGLVLPDEFIPLAEEDGAIVPIGDWVLRTACDQAAEWARTGHPIAVAVNVSIRQLEATADLAESVRSALGASGLDPGSLVLEITEGSLVLDPEATVARLGVLKELGVRIAIDDFGTGHSSMAHLERFPVDTLKIDRSLIEEIGRSPRSEALVRSLVQLGKALGVETLAEGIEQAHQLDHLQAEHCDSGQGFVFARPLAVADVVPFLEARPTRPPVGMAIPRP